MTILEAGTYYYMFGSEMQDRIVVPSGGTSVQVAYWSGTDYVADSSYPMTEPGTIYTRQVKLHLISDGTFHFDDQEALNVAD